MILRGVSAFAVVGVIGVNSLSARHITARDA
jgi:hypothetical protein